MTRRGFLGALAAVLAAPALPKRPPTLWGLPIIVDELHPWRKANPNFQVEAIARMFGVPAHMLGGPSLAASIHVDVDPFVEGLQRAIAAIENATPAQPGLSGRSVEIAVSD